MVIGDDIAVIDERDHVGDGKGEQVGPFAEPGADVKHATALLGIAPVNVWLGELMHGHLAKFEHKPNRMTKAIRIVQERVEFVGGQRAVFLVRDDGLGDEMFAQALLAELFKSGG